MSIKAVTWAFEQRLNDSVAKLVLIGIADRYNPEYGYAYPAVSWLAKVADCSDRTVQRKIIFLEEYGFIGIMRSHPKDGRTKGANKYSLPMLEGVTQCQGVTKSGGGGDTLDVGGVVTPKSHPNNRTIDNYNNMISLFDLFWKACPRKVGKKHALSAFKTAAKHNDPEMLIKAMTAYADLVKRKAIEPRYIKHPSTWLNGGCWEDEEEQPQPENYGVSQRWMPRSEAEFHAKFDQMPDWYRLNRPDVITLAKEAGWLDE